MDGDADSDTDTDKDSDTDGDADPCANVPIPTDPSQPRFPFPQNVTYPYGVMSANVTA